MVTNKKEVVMNILVKSFLCGLFVLFPALNAITLDERALRDNGYILTAEFVDQLEQKYREDSNTVFDYLTHQLDDGNTLAFLVIKHFPVLDSFYDFDEYLEKVKLLVRVVRLSLVKPGKDFFDYGFCNRQNKQRKTLMHLINAHFTGYWILRKLLQNQSNLFDSTILDKYGRTPQKFLKIKKDFYAGKLGADLYNALVSNASILYDPRPGWDQDELLTQQRRLIKQVGEEEYFKIIDAGLATDLLSSLPREQREFEE